MPESSPIARSPIRTEAPVTVRSGWEVSLRRSQSALRLADQSPLAKVLVRANPSGRVAGRLGVPFGQAARNGHQMLVIGSGPGEWLLFGDVGTVAEMIAGVEASDDALVSVLDFTHGRALVRLWGAAAPDTLSKLCAVDFAERVTPNGAAFRSSVAELTTDVVRDDVGGTPSYLLHCERSSGQYLFDVLLEAGREFGIEQEGFKRERT
jgi:heterotetrameric sarcosine oxidase gamma subunit